MDTFIHFLKLSGRSYNFFPGANVRLINKTDGRFSVTIFSAAKGQNRLF